MSVITSADPDTTIERRSGRAVPRWVAATGLAVLIFAIGVGVLWPVAHHVPYHVDEGDYITTARYFDYLFLHWDLRNDAWKDNLATHTQPMLTRYITGCWLWLRGHNLLTLEPTLPPPPGGNGSSWPRWLVIEARAPSVAFAAGDLVLLYWLGYLIAGPIAGIVAAALVLANPWLHVLLVRVIPEPSLTFFLLLTLCLAMIGVRRGRRGELPLGWAVATGIALGLALQSKLTAVFSLVALAGWALMVVAAAWWRNRRELRMAGREVWSAGRGWAVAIVLALAVFVLTNPHLYPNPVLHTEHLFQERSTTMHAQAADDPSEATGNLVDRVSYVLGGSLVLHLHAPTYSSRISPWTGAPTTDDPLGVWHGIPLAVLLAPLAAAWLMIRSWRTWMSQRCLAAEGLLLLTTIVYLVGIAITIGLKWYRYLVPTYVLASLLAGIGIVVALDALREFQRRRGLSRISVNVWKAGTEDPSP